MLTRIEIRNFAIIDEAAVELGPGLAVLTGETGAGKSILIDALGLVLGDRADTSAIRPGSDRAEITAEFDLAGAPAAADWLAEQELDADGDCQMRRVVTAEGRSRGFINGRSTTTANLRALGELLVDIHGQHEHQSLLRGDAQRGLLDDYADHGELLEEVAGLYRRWKERADEVERLRAATRDRDSRLELLRYQVGELEALDLAEGEIDELEADHRRQANAGRLLEQGQRALALAYESDDSNAHGLASRAASELAELVDLDPRFADAHEMLASALVQLQEGAEDLRRRIDDLDMNPERLRYLDERLGSIHELARKHRVEPEALGEHLEALRRELGELEDAEARLDELQGELDRLQADYDDAAGRLSERRSEAAAQLSREATEVMQTLRMPEGELTVTVEQLTERLSALGRDRVVFEVCMNPGQPRQPLNKIASGGELSRISLAIQVAAARHAPIPTMIFDEVDAGIGGRVAEIVGRQLSHLARSRQVLCVTHLPQVASFADRHLQVRKHAEGEETRIGIDPVQDEERVEELARMLGGVEVTARSRDHAREMIERAGADS